MENIVGYTLSSPQGVPDAAVGRVVKLRYIYERGGLTHEEHGSGFIVTPKNQPKAWLDCIVTARHVVNVDPGETPRELWVHYTVTGGQKLKARAAAVAYPDSDDRTHDMAVVKMWRGVKSVTRGFRFAPRDSTHFDGKLTGYPAGSGLRETRSLSLHYRKPWLIYKRPGKGAMGMSGGPVHRNRELFGIHIGEVSFDDGLKDCALWRHVPTLEACKKYAKRLVEQRWPK